MSVYSALNVGVSGINAQSSVLNTISANIANADTVGYKEGMPSFADLVTDDSANNYSVNGGGSVDAGFSPSGVSAGDTQLNDVQGAISASNSSTDIAISGSGFFAVSPTAAGSADGLEYTRAGSFTPDADGNYMNTAGYYLQAWPLTAGTLPASLSGADVTSGTGIAALQTVNIKDIIPDPVTTTTVSLQANLNASQAPYTGPPVYDPTDPTANMASGSVAPDFTVPITVVDSTGVNQTLDVGFIKAATVLSNSGAGPFSGVSSGSTSMTITGAVPAGLAVGDSVSFTGSGAILDSNGNTLLTAADINTTHTVLSVGSGSYTVSTVAADTTAQAAGNITFTANPANGDSIVLNGQIWTFVTGPAAAGQTTIQGTLSDTLAALADNLNADTSNSMLSGATYGVSPAGPASTELTVTYNTAGAAGDNYTLATGAQGSGNETLSGGTLTGGLTTSNTGGNSTQGITGGTGTITQASSNDSTWDIEIYANPPTAVTATDGQLATGTVSFNSDGTLAGVSSSLTNPVAIDWTNGATAGDITFNWGTAGAIGTGEANGLSQSAGSYSLLNVQQNGIPKDASAAISISSDGIISATYNGGNTVDLYQIPLAQFTSPEQLQSLTGNVFVPTVDSGTLSFFSPGQDTATAIDPSSLESSNVDLATQLTNMIIAQNAYQANTKLVSTTDEMMQTLTQMDQSISI